MTQNEKIDDTDDWFIPQTGKDTRKPAKAVKCNLSDEEVQSQ
jgi:hypothetical protein